MAYRRFVPVLWLALALSTPAQEPAGGVGGPTAGPERELDLDRPNNVLVLVADDLGVDMVAAYEEGADLPPTPTLDTLAASGVLFRNAWAQPTCSPARATLLTGQQGFQSGIGTVVIPFQDVPDMPLDGISLPRMLDLAAPRPYAHAAFGKWHVSSLRSGPLLAPNAFGWGHFAGTMEGQLPSYDSWNKVVNGVVQPVTRYATSELVDDVRDWIADQGEPWLCYVAFQAPHAPFHAPPAHLHSQPLPPGGDPRTGCGDPTGDDPRPYFKAMVEAMDREIGRLLASIDEAVLANTTIVFLGDNGTEPCVGVAPFDGEAKSTLYEGGINVPLIVSSPLVTRPGECSALVQSTDVFATVAELAGVDLAASFPQGGFDSVSLVPYLRQPERDSIRRFVFSESFTPNGETDFTIPPCPTRPVCQQDVGFDGPGDLALSSCGTPLYGLYGNNQVPLELSGAPPFAAATLRIGPLQPGFDAQLGANVASIVPETELSFTTDADGRISTLVWTGGISHEPYYQFVVADPAQPNGHAVSNALRMELLDTRMFAVRDARYKLIHFNPCYQEAYDLWLDPFERSDLLHASLTVTLPEPARELRALARRLALSPRAPGSRE